MSGGIGPIAAAPPTPLAIEILATIRRDGPISIAHYMALCLGHPTHGYYMTRDPLGLAGDFTTAPEISQMFGELVGLWAADSWERIGSPAPFHLVELGPGRGTLIADALRAVRIAPAFCDALVIHLVETSPVLRNIQKQSLSALDRPITWHDDLATVPAGATIVIANEFFDALPVRQFEMAGERWCERLVGLDDNGSLAIVRGGAMPHFDREPSFPRDAATGSIAEWSPIREGIVTRIAHRLSAEPGVALVIDYGHAASGYGDTLQAVSGHRPVGILDAPGECDLTAHVDFGSLASVASQAGAECHGPIEMGRFLISLGITERAERLAENANADTRTAIAAAFDRLTEPNEMGSLFKVLALTSPGMPAPAPFSTTGTLR